jgi:hypothetical protein
VGQKIEKDLQRFRKIVRGKVKSSLSKYISRGEMIGKKGNDLVSIPVPSINLPQFRYGSKGSGGVGVGDGQPGQPLTQPQDGEGEPQAGDQPGGHILEVELTMEELAAILGETVVSVNSMHHQAIKDLADGLRPTAFAPDGIIEAVEGTNGQYLVAVQWHPEELADTQPGMRRLFTSFVEAAAA